MNYLRCLTLILVILVTLSFAHAQPSVWIILTPLGPTTLPPAGSCMCYNLAVGNLAAIAQPVDIWMDVTLPDSSVCPILGPFLFTMPPLWSRDRDGTTDVPPRAPAGTYTMNGYIGVYPDTIWVEDHFEFIKTGDGDAIWANPWFIDIGESFEDLQVGEVLPENYVIVEIYPNPFNPTTKISFALPEAGKVALSVYDLSGRLVTTLVNGYNTAGKHSVTFDASGLPSGIYLYRLTAAESYTSGKLVLIK